MATVRSARQAPVVVLALVVAILAGYVLFMQQHRAGAASSLPADKMTATAGDTMVTGPNTDLMIMSAQMKTSNPADLVLNITSECTILSNITNMGTSDTQTYTADVQIYVKIDGHEIPVVPPVSGNGASSGGTGNGPGHVVFCDREFTRTTTFDTSNESIKDVERTETAAAFNWIDPNVGAGVHPIEVWARFNNTNSADAMAHGVISNRSLVVNTTNYLISQQP